MVSLSRRWLLNTCQILFYVIFTDHNRIAHFSCILDASFCTLVIHHTFQIVIIICQTIRISIDRMPESFGKL